MVDLKNVEEKVEEVKQQLQDSEVADKAKALYEKLKDKPEELKNALSNNETVHELLGEDGKLSADDLSRVTACLKEIVTKNAASFTDKAKDVLLGEDGKFDQEDVARLANEAKEGAKGLLDKAKDLFDKKD